jgi:hypothetical protein
MKRFNVWKRRCIQLRQALYSWTDWLGTSRWHIVWLGVDDLMIDLWTRRLPALDLAGIITAMSFPFLPSQQ